MMILTKSTMVMSVKATMTVAMNGRKKIPGMP